jgi:hypothetical protein
LWREVASAFESDFVSNRPHVCEFLTLSVAKIACLADRLIKADMRRALGHKRTFSYTDAVRPSPDVLWHLLALLTR